MQTAGLAISKGIPFSVYGENLVILGQNAIIIFQIWNLTSVSSFEKLAVIGFLIAYGKMLFTAGALSVEMWALITSLNSILTITAKLPQIFVNFSNSSTGQMAFATTALNFLGNVGRLGTVLYQSDDIYFQIQFIVAVCLNGTLFLQFILYWGNPDVKSDVKKVHSEVKGAKKERNKMD
jgi:hypothetical protein